ncbi:hypothetical protein VITFI_CDS3353 (plasmid) [Vitreoscilla filiformis]|uniref:Uncharacterized protein n=1 Tax=Vitreoscilla filiformis TaxID=63 RepID=A0A221KJY9_VITFI|nr:hypothetical protein VITFI_CDS3353 [Vitreoscilla filiformis]
MRTILMVNQVVQSEIGSQIVRHAQLRQGWFSTYYLNMLLIAEFFAALLIYMAKIKP